MQLIIDGGSFWRVWRTAKKKRGEEIRTSQCADDLVVLAKDEKVLQVTIGELVEVGRRYRMECGKNRS